MQADDFRLLMKARWGHFSPSFAAEVCRAWHINPEKLDWLSASPLRVAALIGVEAKLQEDRSIKLTFPDGSSLRCKLVGFKFLEDES